MSFSWYVFITDSVFFLQAEELDKIHENTCMPYASSYARGHVHLSLDGVQEAKSSTNSIDAYSIQYVGCRNVYPLRLIKPHNQYKYDEQKTIKTVFNDINSTNIVIDEVICDNPKRSVMRHSMCHSSTFACEYCEAGAVGFVSQNVEENVKENITAIHAQLRELDIQINHLNPEENKRQVDLLNDLKKTLREKLVNEKKMRKSHVVWPFSTMQGNPRTIN